MDSYKKLFSLSLSGGIDSNNISSNLDEPEEAKTSADTSIVSNSGAGSLSENDYNHNDGAQEDKENSGQEVNVDRREKIAKFLKDQKERKMSHKLGLEQQQLSCMKDDLTLKRKMCERDEAADKAFMEHVSKTAKTMEDVASAMTGCFQMMSAMFQAQMQQQAQMHQLLPQSYHAPSGSGMCNMQPNYKGYPESFRMQPFHQNSQNRRPAAAEQGETYLEL